MTSAFFSRRLALAATLVTSLLIAACGGNDNNDASGTASIRALNLSTDVSSVDIFFDGSKRFDAQVSDVPSGYQSINSGTYTVNVKRPGDGASLLTRSYALSKDQHYTAVVWGRETALNLSTLGEDTDGSDIASGNTRLRIFNATTDTGLLDVYLTTPTANLAVTLATQSNVQAGAPGGFRDLSAGTYRLRITGASDPNDVRLDLPAITLNAQKVATLIITAGAGGVLVNATLLEQQGSATPFKGRKSRVRLAAGVDNAAGVSATVGGTTISTTAASPRIGGYVVVDSGTADLTVRVNGVVASTTSQTFLEGADYTVLAYGAPAAPVVNLLTDDNRLPSTTTRAKLRLVNGALGAGALSLSLDRQLLQPSDIAEGSASSYYAADSANAARIEISSLTATQPLFTQTGTVVEKLLKGQGTYTVFMLGGLAAPQGFLILDR